MAFKEWDADIVKEEEGADGDNHDQVNLSAQELSKFNSAFSLKNRYLVFLNIL